MKRLLILIPIIILGCEQVNLNENSVNSSIVDSSVTVSNDLVNLIALNHFYELHPKEGDSKGADSTLESFSQFDTAFVIKDKKGRNAINFFKYKNDNGWNIIAGDNRFHPILA